MRFAKQSLNSFRSMSAFSKKYVGAIDQGTSSTRFIVFDKFGKPVSSHQLEHQQYFPRPGLVEHDPLEIVQNTETCIVEALKKAQLAASDLAAVGITNQRETTVVWNKETGIPYHNAIVWNDTRTSSLCEKLSNECNSSGSPYGKDRFREKTGLPLAPYFSASKLSHLLDHVPNLRKDAESGLALFGTIDSWLTWKLTDGQVHATDVTNASRTLLMNTSTLQWDDEILSSLRIPRSMLPEIRSSSEVFGTISDSSGAAGVPIAGVLGDQQAALFGQCCFAPGEAKCTYGTGAFLLLNTGEENISSTSGLLSTIGYKIGPNASTVYALEGSVAYSGSLIQWLRDNLNLISSAAESETLASSVPDNGGVYFVPAFAGLYAPYWKSDARGIIVGLTAFNTKAHIVRAALEANAFQTMDILEAMRADSKLSLRSLKVDGGLTVNNLAMQAQSDLLDVPLHRPEVVETTALGAAFAAGLAVGVWSDLEELKSTWSEARQWQPEMTEQKRGKMVKNWKKAIARSMAWLDEESEDELENEL